MKIEPNKLIKLSPKTITKNRCRCGQRSEKLHSCPYGDGIFGYGEKHCKCCKACQNYCARYV